ETAQKPFEAGVTADGLPTTELPTEELEAGIALFALMARAGLAATNSEARRLIKGGGARINDTLVNNETHEVGTDAINSDGVIKLSAGKKRHALIRPI
ncbi:MAG TPA: tyrosine--tRNA ligase, partial [Rhodospirillaceae bacterium]|nr:tyrosine--tRNA ligase [Rhodospirillaceae bacterium]